MMASALPSAVEARVVKALYEAASELDWTHLGPSQRSKQYAKWLETREIGGVLLQYLSREDARLWLKDGPMHEYARALAGVGKYARYAGEPRVTKEAIVAMALGHDWTVEANSAGIKPLHCVATRGNDRVRVFWGPSRDFKHLLWAALKSSDSDSLRSHIAVIETAEHSIPSAERAQHERLGNRCGVGVTHLRSR